MLSKTVLLASLVALPAFAPVAQREGRRSFEGREIERFLPPPSWILAHSDELGFAPDEMRALREHLMESRREVAALKERMFGCRETFSAALRARPFQRSEVEARFEDLLDAETTLKRAGMRARLHFVESISSEQRESLRAAASRAAETRSELRWRIEEIRRQGKRLRNRGGDTASIRQRVRRVERLIRSGDLDAALRGTDELLDELLRSPVESDSSVR